MVQSEVTLCLQPGCCPLHGSTGPLRASSGRAGGYAIDARRRGPEACDVTNLLSEVSAGVGLTLYHSAYSHKPCYFLRILFMKVIVLCRTVVKGYGV